MKLVAVEVIAADTLVQHLCAQVDAYGTVGDPLRDRYVGFCAVTVATHLETLLKTVVLDFCKTQNRYLHSVFEDELQRFNGRIAYQDLRKLLKRFDKSCDARFVQLVQRLNRITLTCVPGAADILSSYDSLLEIRHSFVHNLNATFSHITTSDLRAYAGAGKRVASAFARSLR